MIQQASAALMLDPDSGYVPVDIDLLIPDSTKPFELCVLLGDQYIPYSGPGECFTESIQRRLHRSGTRTLYVHTRDRAALREYMDQNLHLVLREPSLAVAAKSRIIHDVCLFQIENLWASPTSPVIERTKGVVRQTVDYILFSNREGMEHLVQMLSHEPGICSHSVNVGLLGTILAKEMLGHSDRDLHQVGYAMFLHDIGKTQVDQRILTKPGRLSDGEWETMRLHPRMGHQILLQEGHMTPEASITTLQHHERCNAKGYPSGLNSQEIDILGKICNLADSFDALLAKRSYKAALTPFQALEIMKNEMQGQFDQELFRRFICLLR